MKPRAFLSYRLPAAGLLVTVTVRVLLRLSVVAAVAAAASSCLMGRVWTVEYRFETTALRSASGHETTLSTSRDGDDIDLIASDDRAEFSFRVHSSRSNWIEVSIHNRSAEPFSLNLADASYLDPSGQTHELHFLSNSKLVLDRTVEVGPLSTVELSLWPKDWNHGWYEGRPAVWSGDSPLGGSTIEETREKALEERQRDIGQAFEIVLPVGSADDRVSYRFRFVVSELVARTIWWA